MRNGPNPAFEPIGRYHMFDGDGMLHGVTFDDDGAHYRNRWIRSRGLGAEVAHGGAMYPGLGNVMEFPDRSLTGDAGPVKNPANTHIVRHAGRYLALWEGGLPTEVTPSLDTIGEYDFGGKLQGSDDGAPTHRSAHRRDALLRLLAVRALPALLRGRRRRRAGAQGGHSTCRPR